MNRPARFVIGLVVLVTLLLVTGWFDSVVVLGAQQEQRTGKFNFDTILLTRALGFLLIAGSVLLIATTGWRLRSVELGTAYVLFGAFFAFLDTIMWKLAAEINGAPPVLPQPVVVVVNSLYPWEQAPLHGAMIVGAGALLVGVGMLAARLVRPSGDARFELVGYRPPARSGG